MKKLYILLTFGLILAGIFVYKTLKKPASSKTVVVYVSEDRVFSEPILRDFEKETGIKVKAIYDTEESKSTGTMNRIIAEKNNPQADVYWANEPIRAEILKQKGLLQPYKPLIANDIPAKFKDHDGYWTGFSARARVFIVHKSVKENPSRVLDMADPVWKGKVVLANPLFGTTTSQITAIFTLLGDKKAKKFMTDLKSNKVSISTSNGESADFVASGQYKFSLIDSDDVVNRMRQGKPVKMVFPDQGKNDPGCFVVPNTVMLIKNAKHKSAAKKLMDYLLSRKTEAKLAKADCAQIPLHKGVTPPPELKNINDIKTMNVDYAQIANKMVGIQKYLKTWVAN